MAWRQFVMNLGNLAPDAVEDVFNRHGAQAITLTDAGDAPLLEPAPGETPLWPDVRITGLFPESADLDRLLNDLLASLGVDALPEHRIDTLEDRPWEREWLKDFRPMQFGERLWVCPGGFEVDAPGAVVVHLDPGLAFGTGTHPTTALCLEWLDGIDLRGKAVLDFGCGSGILAIASLRLGAATATAVDIDPQAIAATEQNARRNGVAGQLVTLLDAGGIDGRYDVVVANILAAPLIRHAGTIGGHLARGGRIALSGILEDQADAVREAYEQRVEFEPNVARAPWVRLAGTGT